MERNQIFMFIADVVALAARHFGEPQHAAPAAEQPPESPDRPTVHAPPEYPSAHRPNDRDEELLSSITREIKSVFDEDEDVDAGPAETPRPSTPHLGHQTLLDRFSALEEMLSELEKRYQELAAARATNERLRAELAEMQRHQAAPTPDHHATAAVPPTPPSVTTPLRGEDLVRALTILINSASATRRPGRGHDIEATLDIDFSQMACGATVPLSIDADGEPRTLEVVVPAGVVDGATLTLPAQGGAGEPPGDLLVRVRVAPDQTLTRDGDHIVMRVLVTPEALTSKQLTVEAPTGALTVSISAEHLGRTLRCKGKGIARPGQEPGDLLITLDPSPILAASIDQFPSADAAFSALRSLCPAARAHLANLVSWSKQSSDQRDIREVLWGLAVAHEYGLRAPLQGFAAQLLDKLVKHGALPPTSSWRTRRSHVFAWLGDKTPLLTRERPPKTPSLIWTIHFERLGDESAWPRDEGARATH